MTQFFETTQGIMAIGALIGAGCFAAGTVLPNLARLATVGLRRQPKQEARSLAMLTVLALDDFVGASYAAITDTPEFNPMDEGEFAFHVPDPRLSLPKDVDWCILGTDLAQEVLWFSNRVKNLSNALDALDLSMPNYDGFFERRQEGYAGLAAEALDLIERMLEEFKLTLPAKPDYYDQREGLAAAIQGAGERSANRRKASPVIRTNGTNVLQLFPKTGEEADRN